MKRLNILYLFLALTLILGSCGASNNVVSNKLISKRKYNKGFHINQKGNFKKSNEDVAIVEKAEKGKKEAVSEAPTVQKRNEQSATPSNEAYAEYVAIASDSDMDVVIYSEEVANEKALEENTLAIEETETSEQSTESKKSTKSKKRKSKKKSSSSDEMFILAVIFAILIPPLGVAIYTNIDWMKVLICLLLTLLFVLPGMIYALLVVFDVI